MDMSLFIFQTQKEKQEVDDCRCMICSKVVAGNIAEPVLCKDEHLFCRSCITPHLARQGAGGGRCPVDGASMALADLSTSKRVARSVSRLQCKCMHHSASMSLSQAKSIRVAMGQPSGCRWRGNVEQIATHLRTCELRQVPCKDCHAEVPVCAMRLHELVCPSSMALCELCKDDVPSGNMSDHLRDDCPRVFVSCPNICLRAGTPKLSKSVVHEGTLVERSALQEHLDVCPLQAVDCPFQSVGCNADKALHFTRSTLDSHLSLRVADHLRLLLNAKEKKEAEDIAERKNKRCAPREAAADSEDGKRKKRRVSLPSAEVEPASSKVAVEPETTTLEELVMEIAELRAERQTLFNKVVELESTTLKQASQIELMMKDMAAITASVTLRERQEYALPRERDPSRVQKRADNAHNVHRSPQRLPLQ
jgi:TRAF-type zinc finger